MKRGECASPIAPRQKVSPDGENEASQFHSAAITKQKQQRNKIKKKETDAETDRHTDTQKHDQIEKKKKVRKKEMEKKNILIQT